MENPTAILLTFKAAPAAPVAGAAPGKTRFSGVAYSGGIVPNYHWHGDVAIDLADLRKAPGEEVPVLACWLMATRCKCLWAWRRTCAKPLTPSPSKGAL